ncbi:conserved membrane protein of unknown function [Petrocella atlantisensis]|uniref:CDP-diacylglycerol--glycerol-3-phosphate 1-phosphatidyltransferase n=1 Tax=Petrocella atlantisensis TaxID=2173034 RepID=A0A3P7P6I6_9FIRM|nr:CDP-alcohol phosphatidyltransferase family protein [Petrocella atlantisensis]VDN49150.1 conserved membrane protein of unknown function [Petrocella atlantisensis]
MKYIANYITLSRIILSFTLLLFEPFSIVFNTIYIVSGLSDILDGYIARISGTASTIGARLDSVADLIMVTVVLYKYYPLVILSEKIYFWILGIILIRVLSLTVVYIKFRELGILHSYGNKFTGIALFMTPLLIQIIPVHTTAYLLCIFGSVSAVEELVIHLKSMKLDLNAKSLLTYARRV